ncbi:PPE family protein [Mycobacterium spongiae]|uniref:PPE domain-containing protein n=1 Tax=Mycobacterium spongiae TaxID=886343 RepID=A0A975JVP2_9MYCO|nr:PPE family protein [Mycobacterium spongiae]QUR66557.1 PPE domain-containing protein [Mycobacterium spongiae]
MDYPRLRPEINSVRMYRGPGPGSLLAAAVAWDGLVADLDCAAEACESVIAGLTDRCWLGSSSASMAAAVAPYLGWLRAAATEAGHAAAQAREVASSYEAAFAATVDPVMVAANRAHIVALARSNLLGQNAAAIAAVEAAYEQMWAQDVAAMVAYQVGALAASAQLMPWQQPLPSMGSGAFTGTRITVPGASPLFQPRIFQEIIGLTPPQYAALNVAIGENWFPDTMAQVVNYPATFGFLSGSLAAPDVNQSVAIGQQLLHAEILRAATTGEPVAVSGLSLGTVVIDRELAFLATDPTAPAPDLLTFLHLAGPERGLAHTYLPNGVTVPLINYTVGAVPESQYDMNVVYRQYDFAANPPDRPWNLAATLNSLLAFNSVHTPTAFASPDQGVVVSTATSVLGGTTTTYMIPTPLLPLLMPLQQLGVPAPIIGALDNLMRPIVNQGYSQYDPTGGPYLSHGNLVWSL